MGHFMDEHVVKVGRLKFELVEVGAIEANLFGWGLSQVPAPKALL